jgi:lipopolysaccharide biosynthesis protein
VKKTFLDLFFPPNTKRRLMAAVMLKFFKNPGLFFSNLNGSNLKKLFFFSKNIPPGELEKRISRKLNEYGRVFPAGGAENSCAGRQDLTGTDTTSRFPSYADDSKPGSITTSLKLIAFYLPQFHTIPENDRWWGDGFTEWTNVVRPCAQFKGQYQPKLPGELGYYDLRAPEIRRRQVELAENYGIKGFCFHFYWFGGKTLLEMPVKEFAGDANIDFPFCLNWANENWTRRWDGLEKDILIAQKHSPGDDIAFIRHVSGYFSCKNYIRVNGRPLLVVYRPALLPDPEKTAKRWRDWCRENGIGEIYLALTHSFERLAPEKCGFDAAVEFAPNGFPLKDITGDTEITNPEFAGQIFDYREAVNAGKNFVKPGYKKFRGICPGWENEARKPGRGIALANSSPGAYKAWLKEICIYTRANFEPHERFIFINAWNEWSEGAYLEPDQRYGYAFLKATSEAIIETENENISAGHVECDAGKAVKRNETLAIVHLYHTEMWDEIRAYLNNMNGEFDLYISIPKNTAFKTDKILSVYPEALIFRYENRGRDIEPFLRILKQVMPLNYKYGVKLHSKKTEHRSDGKAWRSELLDGILGKTGLPAAIKGLFDKQNDLAIIAPAACVVSSAKYMGSNREWLEKLSAKAGIPFGAGIFNFAAGSMYWFRPAAFSRLFNASFEELVFEDESGQIDGTLAHAYERFFGLVAMDSGMRVSGYPFGKKTPGFRFADAAKNFRE